MGVLSRNVTRHKDKETECRCRMNHNAKATRQGEPCFLGPVAAAPSANNPTQPGCPAVAREATQNVQSTSKAL